MSFNRLALAAALLEYDGNSRARDSAIFAPAPLTAKDGSNPYAKFDKIDDVDNNDNQSMDFLGIKTPSESGYGTIKNRDADLAASVEAYRAGLDPSYPQQQRQSSNKQRRSQQSNENLQFHDGNITDTKDDLDLGSWGLDDFLSKDVREPPPPLPLRSKPGEARASKNRTLSDAANFSDIAAVAYHSTSKIKDDHLLSDIPLFRDNSAVDLAREANIKNNNDVNKDRAQSSLGFYRDTNFDDKFSLPPLEFTSNFDPKYANQRNSSNSNDSKSQSNNGDGDEHKVDNFNDIPPHLRPPEVLKDTVQKVSRRSLLRPKTLIMPTPLQGSLDDVDAHNDQLPNIPTDVGLPLPLALKRARAHKRHTALALNRSSIAVPLKPNDDHGISFNNRNIRASVFAPTAASSHAKGPYVGSNAGLPTARSEGEQAKLYDDIVEDEYDKAIVRARKMHDMELPELQPGTLLGSSLMNDIDARKQAQKDKRRYFAGDERPLMMSADDRRSSNVSNTRMQSVFGVDNLWDRELAKVKALEAAENAEAERVARLIAEKEGKKEAKKALKKKNKRSTLSLTPNSSHQNLSTHHSSQLNNPLEEKENEAIIDDKLDVSSTKILSPSSHNETIIGVRNWFVESESDHTREPSRQQSVEDFDPKRFARPKRNREWRQAPRRSIVPSSSRAADGSLPPVKLLNGSQEGIQRHGYDFDDFDEDEEDSRPVSSIIQSKSQLLGMQIQEDEDESEDERPLSTFIRPSKSPNDQNLTPKINIELTDDEKRANEKVNDDDDDIPLGLKHLQTSYGNVTKGNENTDDDDDDAILGLKPSAMAYQQTQSMNFYPPPPSVPTQSMMGYPGNTMSWNPSIISPYAQIPPFVPPMGMFGMHPGIGVDPMMANPMQFQNVMPPMIPSSNNSFMMEDKQTKKMNSVDRWRKDVHNEAD